MNSGECKARRTVADEHRQDWDHDEAWQLVLPSRHKLVRRPEARSLKAAAHADRTKARRLFREIVALDDAAVVEGFSDGPSDETLDGWLRDVKPRLPAM